MTRSTYFAVSGFLNHISITPSTSGNYFVDVAQSIRYPLTRNGLLYYQRVTPTPTPAITASATNVCLGTPVTITVEVDPNVGAPVIEYYRVSSGTWIGLNQGIGNTYVWNTDVAGTRQFRAISNGNAGPCAYTTETISVTVTTPPTVSISSVPSFNSTICPGTSVMLSAATSGGEGCSSFQ